MMKLLLEHFISIQTEQESILYDIQPYQKDLWHSGCAWAYGMSAVWLHTCGCRDIIRKCGQQRPGCSAGHRNQHSQ
jgi:hypothetical protein